MCRSFLIACMIVIVALAGVVDGRGGRGGGGFHGGGGARGGGGSFHGGGGASHSINRSPSMSRPQQSARPANSGLSRPSSGMASRPGGGSRPDFASRPGGGGAGRPEFGSRPGGPSIGDRPSMRPGQGGAGERFPGGDRPGGGVRPGGGGAGERFPNAGDRRPGRGGAGERFPDAGERFPNSGDRNFNYNRIDHNDWHHGDWHDHWDHGWYNRPAGWWWGGYGAGLATGLVASAIPWGWGYYSYSNPYATQPVVIDNTTVDYSQPLYSSTDSAAQAPPPDAPPDQPTPGELATQSFDAARAAFYQGDYKTALDDVNAAIAKVPDDTSLHEFRALVLFAMGKYQEAAGAVYAVLSTGPGWDWTTLSGLYPNNGVYTQQLRALEAYGRQHRDDASVQFLLAYHYLTCGETSAAAKQLEEVVRLNPKDALAAQLLAGLTPPDEKTPPQPAPAVAAPKTPATAATLAGQWKATQPDGTSIALDLGKDAKYTWQVTRDGKKSEFGGTYTVADNLLVLNQDNNPAMVGQVAQSGAGAFNFRLPGAPPSDPGLSFVR